MNQKLKDHLPQLALNTLGQLDRGAVERRFRDAINCVLDNISKFPFRDNTKVETRAIHLSVFLTPELRMFKSAVESGHGRQVEVDVAELAGLSVRVKIKSNLPDAETADVRMACDIINGKINDVRFNPDNNAKPDQLELEYTEDDGVDRQPIV